LIAPAIATLIGGTVVIGSAYAWQASKIDVKQFDADILSKNAANMISEVEKGFTSDNADANRAFLDIPGISNSAMRPPPTERGGYAQAALYMAVASAMDKGNPQLLGKSKELLAKSQGASTDATEAVPIAQKTLPLQEAIQVLASTQNQRFVPIIQRLMVLSRPEGVRESMGDVQKYSTSTLGKEALGKTAATAMKPIVVLGSLITGNNPFPTLSGWQWQAIRWSVLVGGGYIVFRIVTGPVREAWDLLKEVTNGDGNE
jgi:hypothetical protein